jgi:RNA polymerase sigma-70 factor (ECF subfamily)
MELMADPSSVEPPQSTDPSDALWLDDLVGRLDMDRRAAFVLTQFLGMTYEETAVICGCAAGTVASRVARARDDLLRMIAGEKLDVGPPATQDPDSVQATRVD